MVKFKALQSAKVTEKVTEKVTKKVTDKTYGALTESEKKILEIADRLTVSRKTVSQKIKDLKDKGIISRVEAVV